MAIRDLGARLGNRIRARRELLGLSQAQLAEAAGVTPNYVGVLERGEKLPALETLEAFGEALGTSIGELLGEDEPDRWADEAVALARAVPTERRALALALLRAVVLAGRDEDRRRYHTPARERPHAVAEPRARRRHRGTS